jgi:hypothetical protein
MRLVANTGLQEPVHFFGRPIAARDANLAQTLSQESHAAVLRFRVPRGRGGVEVDGRLACRIYRIVIVVVDMAGRKIGLPGPRSRSPTRNGDPLQSGQLNAVRSFASMPCCSQ